MFIVAVCDQEYAYEHGHFFINSVKKSGMIPRLYILGDSNYISGEADVIGLNLSEFIDRHSIKKENIVDMKALYASARFFLMEWLVMKFGEILIVDVDCFVRKPFQIPSGYDVGLYLRENNSDGINDYERTGMKVAAGAVYCANADFAKKIKEQLTDAKLQWFCDQVALWNVYQEMKDNILVLDLAKIPNFLDWDFKEESAIWSGKGQRKFSDKYKNERSNYGR